MKPTSDLSAFAREVNRPPSEVNLGRAVLLMGAFEYPELDPSAYEAKLDQLAEAALARRDAERPAAVSLAQFLFDELGFAGNASDYHDPLNSFLNQVLERRLGIPISLSVLFLEVASRLGIEAAGVGLPGHFIVRADDGGRAIFLDPFHNGAQLTEQDCRERVRSISDGRLAFHAEYLAPVSPRYILTRMLNNLKNSYAQRSDLARARAVIERLLVLNPDDASERRNLGLILAGLGRKREAVAEFEAFLSLAPDSPDAPNIRRFVSDLLDDVAHRN